MKKIIFVFFCFLTFLVKAQIAVVVNAVPANTPANDTIFIAGSFNNWNPGDLNYQLKKQSNGNYTITLPACSGSIQYKFTRDDWTKVETQSNGQDIANRNFTCGSSDSIKDQILGWHDLIDGIGCTSTASWNVHIMTDSFFIPQLNRYRRIWVYLPPQYDSTSRRYPVLYMHDGQNLFDVCTSFAGEWGIDETLNSLFNQGDSGCIVVGIDNSQYRLDEYSPWINKTYGGGEGSQYVDFIVQTLKPYIDAHYRTKTDRSNTGIAGSSMGGLISFYAAMKYQNVFGKAGIFSPSFWFADSVFTFAQQAGHQQQMKIYFVCGDNEGDASMVTDMKQMFHQLVTEGFDSTKEIFETIVPGAQHSETYWRQDFPGCYEWLNFWQQYALGINPVKNNLNQFFVSDDPSQNQLQAHLTLNTTQSVLMKLISIDGKIIDTVLQKNLTSGIYTFTINKSSYTKGIYLMVCKIGDESFTDKVVFQ
jgi:predicted alpha/beta superfamily hydrolase